MPEIKLVTDETLLEEAFKWADAAPLWFRQSQEKESLAEFIESADEKLFYGIWDGEFTALIRLNPVASGTFSIDLFAKRTTDMEVLKQAGYSLQQYLFDKGVVRFVGWIMRQNRGIRKLYATLGFHDSQMRCFKQSTHGKPIEWILMVNENTDSIASKTV